MDTARWEQIAVIFHHAVPLEADERTCYLAEACSHDPSLREEVESLISSHEVDTTFLQQPVFESGLKILAMDQANLSAGESIGIYTILSALGSGGMGSVYLAFDPRLRRKVALKLLPSKLVKDEERVRRFRQEARAASKISHPNVASIYEVGRAEENHFIAMEFVDGITLRERLSREPMPLNEAIDIAIQVGLAIEAAHEVGIVHRDIKPENIMIRRDGYLKVLDFGLAKLSEAHPLTSGKSDLTDQLTITRANLTEPGMLVGTVTYMSPEQARGLPVDQRSDLWSLGVVLYEIVTQTSPFSSETPSDTIAAILKTEPRPPSLLSAGLPTQIDRIVAKSLAKARDDRYQTAHGLLEDLNRLQETLKEGGTAKDLELTGISAAKFDEFKRQPSTPHRTDRWARQRLGRSEPLFGYVVGTIRQNKVGLMLVLSMLIVAIVALKYINYSAPRVNASPIRSIAVLPLADGSSDSDSEYISDGLSESLIERLSRLSRLKVIARSSSFKYKGQPVEPKVIAQNLGVQALVVGTVTRQADDLLIKVELVSGADNLWTGQYRYKHTDLPLALNEISRQIAGRLNLNLSPAELDFLTRDHAAAGNAYELYLKGRYYWNQLTEDSLNKSIEYFNDALKKDPQYALAYTGLANSYLTLGGNYRSPAETFPKAEQYAQQALDLDEGLAEAHYARAAALYIYKWDLSGAEKELRRTLQLNPNYAAANSLLCSVSLTRGDTQQAMVQVRRALDRDPLSLLFNTLLSYVYYYDRQNQRAVEQLQKTLKQEANAPFLYNDLAKVYAQMGQFDDALASSQRATILMGQDPDTLSSLGIVYALSGKKNEARWVAETLEKVSKTKFVQAYLIASIYGALGDKDQAFTWLAKANRQRSPQLLRFKVDPTFEKIRSDRRYEDALEELRFS